MVSQVIGYLLNGAALQTFLQRGRRYVRNFVCRQVSING